MAAFHLKDRVALVTGASQGIGAALALELARRGVRVALSARSAALLEEVRARVAADGGEAVCVAGDVNRPEDVSRMVAAGAEKWGRMDVLVNNAGYGLWGACADLPVEEIRKNFETNVFAAIACAQAAIARFRRQGGGGMIVNVESLVALRSIPFASCYGATKHALHAFSDAMRSELRDENIRVLSVCPGLIDTEFGKHRVMVGPAPRSGPRRMHMPVDQCARIIADAMERGRKRVIVTGHARAIALLQRIAPGLLDWVFDRYAREKRAGGGA